VAGLSGTLTRAGPPLFQRKVRLIISPPSVVTFAPFSSIPTAAPTAITIEDLRIQFKIRKTLEKEPNNSEISVFNLNEEHRTALTTARGYPVVLEAGYKDTISVIASGDCRIADPVRDGANWITKIQIADGWRSFNFGFANQSFSAGASAADVIVYVINQMGLDANDAIATVRANVADNFSQGYVAFGVASKVLNDLLKGRGMSYSIQGGRLQIRVLNAPPTEASQILLTPDTGLIGSPVHSTPDRKNGRSYLQVKAFLEPRIRPGSRITIQCKGIKGDFMPRRVEHSGDTHGGDWYTSTEAWPVS
jgi:hypothetical protein